MKIELNFKPDVPNLNGRIYPKNVLDKAINEAIESDLFIHLTYLGEDLSYKEETTEDIAAKVSNFENNMFEFEYLDTPKAKEMKDMVESGAFIATTAGIGSVEPNEDGIPTIQDDFKITSLFITPRVIDEKL